MLEAARLLSERVPGLRFEVSAANARVAEWMRAHMEARRLGPDFCRIGLDRFYPLVQEAAAGMVCSGTATLEAAFFGLPMLITYKVASLTWAIGKLLVRIPFLGMPNVLAGRAIVPELLQGAATPRALAEAMETLLRHPEQRRAQQEAFKGILAGLGPGGAGQRAAHAVAEFLRA